MLRLVIIVFILPGLLITTTAQSKRKIYLGKDMDTIFVTDMITCGHNVIENHVLFGYKPINEVKILKEGEDNQVDRIGVILSAKSRTLNNEEISFRFGDSINSCNIWYKHKTEKTRHGKSLSLSILNILSKPEDRSPQEEPYEEISYKEAKGFITVNGKSSDFLFSYNIKKIDVNERGWLLLNGDTLLVKPVQTQINKRGKIKKVIKSSRNGLLLMKQNTVVAAIDYSWNYRKYYILDKTAPEDKMIIIAYLLITHLL